MPEPAGRKFDLQSTGGQGTRKESLGDSDASEAAGTKRA